jgi:hypothetical protein
MGARETKSGAKEACVGLLGFVCFDGEGRGRFGVLREMPLTEAHWFGPFGLCHVIYTAARFVPFTGPRYSVSSWDSGMWNLVRAFLRAFLVASSK